MQQKKNKGAVLKGLAFPVGYFVYMNAFQIIGVFAIMGICLARALLALIAVPEIGINAYVDHYMQDYVNLVNSNTWFLSALTTVSAILILWFVFNRKGKNFIEYFRFKKAPFKAILIAVLLGLSGFFITNAIMSFLQPALLALLDWMLTTVEQMGVDVTGLRTFYDAILESMGQMYDGVGMFTLAAIFGAPLIEELVFRAGPLNHLTKKMPAVGAIMLTAGLFALAHGNPLQMIYTFGLGVVAGYLYVKTDSIYPAIVCHFTFNGANIIGLFMDAMFRTDFWEGNYYYDQICEQFNTYSTVTFWIYLIVTVLISIPMMIVGIIMLVKLRKPAAPTVSAPAVSAPVVSAPAPAPAAYAPAQAPVQASVQASAQAPVQAPRNAPVTASESVAQQQAAPSQAPCPETPAIHNDGSGEPAVIKQEEDA